VTHTQVAVVAICLLMAGGLALSGWWRDRHVRRLRRVCYRFVDQLAEATQAGDFARADVLRGMLAAADEAYIQAMLDRR